MLTLSLFLLLFVFCSSIYAVGETVRQKIRLQNACDAAAYSAAVVQADGLSRMATVNQAMAWSYVQMTNHQMDYITYKWLKLSVQRYDEDKKNAEGYHAFLVVNFNIQQGIPGLIAAAGDLAVNRIVGYFASSMQLRCNRGHAYEGPGWWAGQGPGKEDYLKLNGHGINEAVHRNTIISALNSMDGITTPSGPSSGSSSGNPVASGDDDKPEIKYPELNELIGAIDPEDPDAEDPYYGLDLEDSTDLMGDLDSWYQKSQQTIENKIKAKYASSIDLEEDPDEKEKLENARDAEIQKRKSELSSLYEEYQNDINSNYNPGQSSREAQKTQWVQDQMKERGIQTPDANASQEEKDEYYRQMQALQDEYDSSNIGDSGSSSSSGSSDAGLVTNGSWEATMKAMIKTDKQTIQLMNESLGAINLSMQSSMRSVAEFVLIQMMRDPRITDEQFKKKYQAYISIPQGFDPYSALTDDASINEQAAIQITAGGVAKNIFAPVFNTEPNERLFLQFGSNAKAEWTLHQLFFGDGDAAGLDQWFVRTSEQEAADGVRPRTEGALGIQRGYKDSNLNETNAGWLAKKEGGTDLVIDRGNHIVNFFLDGKFGFGSEDDDSERSTDSANQQMKGDNALAQFLRKTLSSIFTTVFTAFLEEINGLCDIRPSCGNARREEEDYYIPMCSKSKENASLYSEYEWSSAKWLCLARAKYFALYAEYLFCRKFHSVYCDIGKKKHRMFDVKHRGLGHYHIPKWFCGAQPRFEGDFFPLSTNPKKDMIIQFALLDMIPPFAGTIEGRNHGYLDNTICVDKLLESIHGHNREEYRSCACMIDGLLINGLGFATGGNSGLINGHARIYGDDRDIWDPETYVGEVVKPWLLSEHFFSGGGTIVVGAAMKHENPFVQLFSMLRQGENAVSEKSVLSAFDPPSYNGIRVGNSRISGGNYMWTMSAARAGVRRVRRNGAFDQERMYQVVYDSTSDPENLSYVNNAVFRYNDQESAQKTWTNYATSGESVHKHNETCVLSGCVCTGNNTKQIQNVWNLCEQDWDATLLPLRYAGSAGKLNGLDDDATYQSRQLAIRSMNLTNDCGNGANWTWTPTSAGTSAGNANPLNPADDNDTGWHSLDSTNEEKIKLDSLLPDGIHKLDLQNLLRQNRIL